MCCLRYECRFPGCFKSRCPWIKGVYDKFHLIKNFNEKLVSEVRKDEQARLIAEWRPKEAERLKRSKYTLMTTEETRHRNDHPEADKDGKISGYLQPPDTHITKLKSKKRSDCNPAKQATRDLK